MSWGVAALEYIQKKLNKTKYEPIKQSKRLKYATLKTMPTYPEYYYLEGKGEDGFSYFLFVRYDHERNSRAMLVTEKGKWYSVPLNTLDMILSQGEQDEVREVS